MSYVCVHYIYMDGYIFNVYNRWIYRLKMWKKNVENKSSNRRVFYASVLKFYIDLGSIYPSIHSLAKVTKVPRHSQLNSIIIISAIVKRVKCVIFTHFYFLVVFHYFMYYVCISIHCKKKLENEKIFQLITNVIYNWQ